ncbi:ankyrin repeat domain-containing protein [Occultella kanbiaonis]|uniref:ankyrin repeat domain-containing protein n=1 Tax=Occultella kanbiaonis TaxID=2675754 RepID=UPI0012B6ECA0|nr:ankyrin repeat domain-containing protein [Occultella kanbiaonis]
MPEARWNLPDDPSLEWLRSRAKQLRRAFGDPDADEHALAVELVNAFDPGSPSEAIQLSRAQRVLARAFGFPGWSRLREHLETLGTFGRPMAATGEDDSPEDRLLRLGTLNYTQWSDGSDARAMLAQDPTLAVGSAHTMAACGRAEELAELLRDDPAQADRQGGPHRWEPLLYACYSRLGTGDAVRTVQVLLNTGADPNAGFLWRRFASPFTALTGALGGGERGEPPHRAAVALATTLLAAGADPNDNQAFYNRMFTPDDSHLPPLLSHGAGHPHPSVWRNRLGAAYPTPEQMVGEHLRSAAERGYTERVRLLLEHGVDPNTVGYHPNLGDQTAYEIAVRNGHREAVGLLASAGGRSDRLDDYDLLLSAAFAGDTRGVGPLPDLPARRPDAMRLAAEQHGIAALALLVDLGYDVSARGRCGTTALHEAAFRGDSATCRWLVDHGADRTAEDERFSGTPSDWAAHAGHEELAEELSVS